MLRTLTKTLGLTALVAVMISPGLKAQNNMSDADYYDDIRIDRYLDVEVWTNHSDNEFYDGDNIVLNFRTNRDAFVAIYSIDSRGRVNMLFPAGPGDDNYVHGGVTYRFPDGADDFDLVVSGPDGVENIQIVASRERFAIPDWYPTSGLICDWDDRFDYMDYINAEYFVRYEGQRFAFDRTAIYVNHWEPYYYRPIYHPIYPHWTVCGNIYIDYPYGGTVYINGVYWGVAPLYIPRIFVGWHTVTVYDVYGYCWEYPVHVTRYNTIVLDHNIIVTSPTVVSKYKEVRTVGYRDPVLNGYPTYKTAKVVTTTPTTKGTVTVTKTKEVAPAKTYIRGSAKVVKTDRGYETVGGAKAAEQAGKAGSSSRSYRSSKSQGTGSARPSQGSSGSSGSSKVGRSGSSSGSGSSGSSQKSTGSSNYYQKKSSSSSYKSPSSSSSKSSSQKSYDSGKSSSQKSSSPDRSSKSSTQNSSVEKKAPSSTKSSSGNDTKQKSDTQKSTNTTKDKKSGR